jgi:hypothetical protein
MPSISLSGQTRQRQIVILAVGGLILAGLLMFQLPRTLKMVRGSESAPAPAATTPPPVTPGTPVTPVAPPVSVATTPSPVRPAALTRFKSKDPFLQQINPNAEASDTAGSSASSSESSSDSGNFRAVESANGDVAIPDSATIAVNGSDEVVRVSNYFPKANPVFTLVSVGENTAKVGIANGELKGKGETGTVTLSEGEPLTLLNTVDGKRYTLELISSL